MRKIKSKYKSIIILAFLLARFCNEGFAQINQASYCVFPGEPVDYFVGISSPEDYDFYSVNWYIYSGSGQITSQSGGNCTVVWNSLPATLGCEVNYYRYNGTSYYVADANSFVFNVQEAPVNITNVIKSWNDDGRTGFLNSQTPSPIIEAVPITTGTCTPPVTYKWYKSNSPNGPFDVIVGADAATLYFSSPLTETVYLRRDITLLNGSTFPSNVLQYTLLPDIDGANCFDTYGQEFTYKVNDFRDRHTYMDYHIDWTVTGGEITYEDDENVTVKARWYSYPASITAHITWVINGGIDDNGYPDYYNIVEDYTVPVYPNSSMLINEIKSSTGKTSFNYNQVPDGLTESISTSGQNTCSPPGYQWLSSTSALGPFTQVSGATGAQLSFNSPLPQTTYYQRAITASDGSTSYSNTIKVEVVSANWEDLNYIRVHVVTIPGVTDWKTVDQLPIGQKLQSTTYLDGMGRPTEKVGREVATPSGGGTLWGDAVQVYEYDPYGRQTKGYLPYTTTVESGKFKSDPITNQSQYYNGVYNESNPFNTSSYDNSPLNRLVNVKLSGTSWANSSGIASAYELNDATDNIQIFNIGFNTGDVPVHVGVYADNTLFKTISTDENNKQVVEYHNTTGQVICKKVQLDDNPAGSYGGWICTYFIYDDFGHLRFECQPEAVKWLDANGWDFSAPGATQMIDGLCFRYEYDEKGRNVLKKAPGAKELYLIYDKRNRLVFTQDGNQRAQSMGEWVVYFYDELDRNTLTGLYKTVKTISNLKTDANNSINYSLGTGNNTIPNIPANYLDVPTRDPLVPQYKAGISVTLLPGFESMLGDAFEVIIDPQMIVYSTTGQVTFSDPVPSVDVNDPSKFTALKYNYYDDYSYTGTKVFDNNYNNSLAYAPAATVEPIVKTARTASMMTGTKVRVLGTSTFLMSTFYYDEKGRRIQTLAENIKTGTDVTTGQYHFDGRLLSNETRHSASATVYSNFSVLTKYNYDQIGRVIGIEKKYGTNGFKTIASNDLDDMGRMKTKHLDPGYTGSGKSEMESLTYSYNIHGQITGINKDYALKTPGVYNKWGNFFGLCLGYDKTESVFNNSRLDGLITGSIWTTQGDDAQRKYDYTYDNAGRLTRADFKEFIPASSGTTAGWSNAKMDFSVAGLNGKIEYDLNGNLLYMIHKGVMPGLQTPVKIDDLRYFYGTPTNRLSNQLTKVNDLGDLVSMNSNGKLGDFTDGSNGDNDDYVYDDNGNLVKDFNKDIKDLVSSSGNGITYNYLDKPEEIRIAGKGTIKFVYDAVGNKLQKIYTPDGGSTSTVTSYVNEFVYQGNELQYINFEEGRIRVIQAVNSSNAYDFLNLEGNMDLPGGKRAAYDFFIRDYLGNVRMIVSEELHTGRNTCTMETANGRDANEAPVFGQVDANGNPTANNEVRARFAVNGVPGTPGIPGQSTGGGWQNSDIGDYVSRIGNLAGSKVGPNALLKVMAGDTVTASSLFYYQNPVVNKKGGPSFVSDLLVSLAQVISGSPITSNVAKTAASNITSQLGSSVPFGTFADPDVDDETSNAPKAYLGVLYFDERFNFVGEGSTTKRVNQTDNGINPLITGITKAPKNGYALVYVCNESDEMVYFDNLQVAHNRGRIIEENHYYAYGLKIAGISSRKLADAGEGDMNNRYQFNDKELIDEADLDWYDYGFRNYDPQIGRFPQLDPLTFEYPSLTPYQYASCEPISNIDEDGLEAADATKDALHETLPDFIFTYHPPNWVPSVIHGIIEGVQMGAIETRGAEDAMANANTVGLYELIWGDHGDEYSDPADKIAYYTGKRKGYIGMQIQGWGEIGAGGGAALVSGGGAAPVAIPLALHGIGVEFTVAIQIKKVDDILNQLEAEYHFSALNSKVTTDRDGLEDPDPEDKSRLGRKYDPEQRTIVESKEATAAYKRLDPNMKRNVDNNIDMIRKGLAGKNQHVLGRDLKGYKGMDLPGTGNRRGGVRIVYRETDKEIFIKDITNYHTTK